MRLSNPSSVKRSLSYLPTCEDSRTPSVGRCVAAQCSRPLNPRPLAFRPRGLPFFVQGGGDGFAK